MIGVGGLQYGIFGYWTHGSLILEGKSEIWFLEGKKGAILAKIETKKDHIYSRNNCPWATQRSNDWTTYEKQFF